MIKFYVFFLHLQVEGACIELQQAGLDASLPSIPHTVNPSVQILSELLIVGVAEDYL